MFSIRSLWNRITRADGDIVCISLSKDGVEVSACGRVGYWRLETPLTSYAGPLTDDGWRGFSGAYAEALRDCHLSNDGDLTAACVALQELHSNMGIIDPIEEQFYNDVSPEVTIVRK